MVLHTLRGADGPLGIAELAEAVLGDGGEPVEDDDLLDDYGEMVGDAGEPAAGEPCPDCGGVHVPMGQFPDGDGLPGFWGQDDDVEAVQHAADVVVNLINFGGAVFDGGTAALTPLGSMLATSLFEGCAPAPDADTKTLLDALGGLPAPVGTTMAGPWLAARPADAAVRELLAFAESVTDGRRIVALALAETLGPAPAAVWREWARKPGFGAYARRWLGEQGKPVAVHPEDEAWLLVDAFTLMLENQDDDTVPFSMITALQQMGGLAQMLEVVRGSGHPAADQLEVWLGGTTPTVSIQIIPPGEQVETIRPVPQWPPVGTAGVYQLKISLYGVDDPPVWRRVLVPADFTLRDLHHVIQNAMGWDEEHLHVFQTKQGDYGVPDRELGYADEAGVTLAGILPRKRSKLIYSYDFGDDWAHDVVVEERRPATPGEALPRCVAGEGACPPEDCGGPWGYENLKEVLADEDHEEHFERLDWMGLEDPDDFDAAAFSLDEVNERLAPRA
jgi:hypothetical protein